METASGLITDTSPSIPTLKGSGISLCVNFVSEKEVVLSIQE